MNRNELREVVLQALGEAAPGTDIASLDDTADVREALDLDSMDVLRFAQRLHDRLGVDIPETDYAQIAAVGRCVLYLESRLGAAGAGAS